MKGMKGRLLKKLKSVRAIGYVKPDRVLHVNAEDGCVYTSPMKLDGNVQIQFKSKEEEPNKIFHSRELIREPEIIDVTELMTDLQDEETDSDDGMDDKENISPETESKKENLGLLCSFKKECGNTKVPEVLLEVKKEEEKQSLLSEMYISPFRSPDLDSGTLFDPNLLAAFKQAVMEVKAQEAEMKARVEEQGRAEIDSEPPLKARKIEEKTNPLLNFEEKCPPGGADSVVFYTTGLRGIRKTFEDCHKVRFLLESFRVLFSERDVSMHSEFREEMWRILEEKLVPPRLFIKGRYIGGAEEVLAFHEQGKLRPLLKGIPIDQSQGPCVGCYGIRFVVCFCCNGSQKIVREGDEEAAKCSECNENGLIICPLCC